MSSMEEEPQVSVWRRSVAITASINALAAVWLLVAPFVLRRGDRPIWIDLVGGGLVAGFAVARLLARRQAWLSFLNILVGGWLLVEGIAGSPGPPLLANRVAVGGLVALVAFVGWSAGLSESVRGRSG